MTFLLDYYPLTSTALDASASGSATTSGQATLGPISASASGTATTSGQATLSAIQVTASGTATTSGQATLSAIAASASGTVITTGQATISAISASATGSAQTSGQAGSNLVMVAGGDGSATTSGQVTAIRVTSVSADGLAQASGQAALRVLMAASATGTAVTLSPSAHVPPTFPPRFFYPSWVTLTLDPVAPSLSMVVSDSVTRPGTAVLTITSSKPVDWARIILIDSSGVRRQVGYHLSDERTVVASWGSLDLTPGVCRVLVEVFDDVGNSAQGETSTVVYDERLRSATSYLVRIEWSQGYLVRLDWKGQVGADV